MAFPYDTSGVCAFPALHFLASLARSVRTRGRCVRMPLVVAFVYLRPCRCQRTGRCRKWSGSATNATQTAMPFSVLGLTTRNAAAAALMNVRNDQPASASLPERVLRSACLVGLLLLVAATVLTLVVWSLLGWLGTVAAKAMPSVSASRAARDQSGERVRRSPLARSCLQVGMPAEARAERPMLAGAGA